MPSAKLLKIAHTIAQRDRAVFDTLIEFENTRRVRTKTRLNFTIDNAVVSRFRKFCREHGYSMSAKVEHAIKDILNKG